MITLKIKVIIMIKNYAQANKINYPTDRKNNNIIKLIWNKNWFKKGFLIVCHKVGKLQTNLRLQKLKKLCRWIFRLAGLVISNFKSFNKKKNWCFKVTIAQVLALNLIINIIAQFNRHLITKYQFLNFQE